MAERAEPQTLYAKLLDRHCVARRADGASLIYIDRHYVHEGSHLGFTKLAGLGLALKRPDRMVAVADHYVPTTPVKAEPERQAMIDGLARNAAQHDMLAYNHGSLRQGIVHVIGPEQGLTLPGMTVVCGDSHTSSHGALGALAFGIGASEVCQVMATQTLWHKQSKAMRLSVDGILPIGTTAKDLALAIIGRIGNGGAAGCIVEFAGSAIRALSMEARLTLCNMTIEAGARAGLIAADDTTFEYVAGRPYAPSGAEWDRALADWKSLRSDPEAAFDVEVSLDGGTLTAMATWGTSPEDVASLSGYVPDPEMVSDLLRRDSLRATLDYMGLVPNMKIKDIKLDIVFIGSCTNGRIEDLRAAAKILEGRKVAPGISAIVAPGSVSVKHQAEAEGLDKIFRAAGFEWRSAGCSMCIGMNGDLVPAGQRCASTSNRNFRGRQGVGARTHLVSPATAAASAVTGFLTDASQIG